MIKTLIHAARSYGSLADSTGSPNDWRKESDCAAGVQLQIEQFGGYGDNGTWKKQRQISYVVTYMWNLKKNDTNELIYKREIDSQT